VAISAVWPLEAAHPVSHSRL